MDENMDERTDTREELRPKGVVTDSEVRVGGFAPAFPLPKIVPLFVLNSLTRNRRRLPRLRGNRPGGPGYAG